MQKKKGGSTFLHYKDTSMRFLFILLFSIPLLVLFPIETQAATPLCNCQISYTLEEHPAACETTYRFQVPDGQVESYLATQFATFFNTDACAKGVNISPVLMSNLQESMDWRNTDFPIIRGICEEFSREEINTPISIGTGASAVPAEITLSAECGDVQTDDELEEERRGPAITTEALKTRFNGLNQFRGVGRGSYAVSQIIGRIIFWFMGIIGTIAIAMFVYAGATWMFMGANPEARKKAVQTMVWTTLGVAVLLGSGGIVQLILNAFIQ